MNLSRMLTTRAAATAAFILAAFTPIAHAFVDLNGDNIPDIWALKYGAAALSPSGDADGDGMTNANEAAAGTNPLDAGQVIKISSVTLDGTGAHVVFPTQEGKRYQLQRTDSPANSWSNIGSLLIPTASNTLTADDPAPLANGGFYRVRMQEIDSDGDGVSDWEEIQVGFDPYSTHSNGPGAQGDLAAITASLQATGNVVTVTSTGVPINEPASGGVSTDTGTITIRRSGRFEPITVNYATSGGATAGSDYVALTGSVTLGFGVNTATLTIAPLPDLAIESTEAAIVTATAGANYTVGSPSAAAVLINDYVTAIGNGVLARFWNNTSATIPTFINTSGTVNLNSPVPVLSRVDDQIDNTWGTASPGTNVNADYFVSRFTADVLPEFSQVYTFEGQVERGGRLWVNGQLLFSSWSNSPTAGTYRGQIELAAGKRYALVFEHMARSGDATAILRWESTNQAKQVIPKARLFANAPPQILGELSLLVLRGSPTVNYQIVASGEPTSYSAANLPAGWSINTSSGILSINPTVAGTFQIPITASNAAGSGSAILEVNVISTDAAITRDVWTGVPGTAVSDIPLDTNPTSTGTISSLEGPQNAADDYGARIRGYLTAPTTGVYKFFLTASNAAELYISNDDEPVNAFKRAAVTTATNYREWTNANAGKSPLLQLYAGRRYYVEVRHKAGAGSDHVSVGWMQPGQGGNDPGAYVPASGSDVVVPGFVLSTYTPPSAGGGQETLYFANLTPQGGVTTTAYGSIIVALSADETQATLRINYSNLTSGYFGMHLHDDRIPNPPGGLANVVCDLDQPGDATPAGTGSWLWVIQPRGGLSVADIVDGIKTGHTYFNVHSILYPSGEIKGYLKLLEGSQTFTPPAPLTWTDPESASNPDSHLNRDGAARFLIQATYGVSGADISPANGNPDDIDAVQSLGFEGWITAQFGIAPSYHYPYVYANRVLTNPSSPSYPGTLLFNSWWKNSVQGPDQLLQRLAFALSEILVTSEAGPLDDRADAVSDYYDMLLQNAFGNFKDLLVATTLHPAMGRYLDMLNNDKPDLASGRIPNENYAREIKQLFSIGLNRLHPDGSLVLNSKGELIPTYDQDAIIGFAHAFTGWSYNSATVNPYPTSFAGSGSWLLPMTPRPARHFTGQKRTLDNVVLPGLAVVGGQPLDPYAAHTTTQINDPAYQALPAAELDATHEQLFRHPNCGPFICRQLIQRFVTGTPSRGYLYRVVQKFNDNGSGVRGDMQAVIKAILLDYEARSSVAAAAQGFGKQREPIVRVTGVARAFPSPPNVGGTYTQVGGRIDVTTVANHLYSAGNSVYLDFAASTSGDAGQPTDATYSIVSTPVVTPTTFSVRVRSTESDIEYTQANGITTFRDTDSSTNDFEFVVGDSVAIEYVDGTPSVPTSGFDTLDYISSDEYTLIFGNPTTKRGTYSRSAGSTTMTVNITAHGYTAGSTIHLEAVSGTAPLPAITTYTIDTATTNSFTVTTADAPTAARSGTIFATPPADLVPTPITGNANLCRASEFANRSGTMEVTYSDWNMDSTNTDLNQTPMQSPTVFNFFLPDYQFPGILSDAGLITPEFELTSETSVIRQANTLYNGLFNDALGTIGLSSFKNGGRDIVLDLRPWLGAGPGGLPWTHTNNLNALIDELNTRLMAGKLDTTGTNTYGNPRVIVNSKQAIFDYVKTLAPQPLPIVAFTSGSNPCEIRVTNHGLSVGSTITISGVTGGTFASTGGPSSINSTFQVIAINSSNRFTVGINCVSATGVNYTNATILQQMTPTQARDRLRSVLHLLITSPDFTIQK